MLLSDYPADDELALLVLVPHTPAVLGNRWEFRVTLPFLRAGAFHLQQIQQYFPPRLERRLGELPSVSLAEVRQAIIRLLRLQE